MKDAYAAKPLTRLGKSDHDLIMLTPNYKPLVQRQKPRVLQMDQWTPQAISALQGSLECTDWDVFIDNADGLNELTDTVTEYIKFCKESVVPVKEIKIYPNNKPWITKDIKDLLNKKNEAFGKRDRESLKCIQKKLDKSICSSKQKYKRKIEDHFKENNMKDVWNGMRLMSGFNTGCSKSKQLPDNSVEYANDLNNFYNRFDKHDFSVEHSGIRNSLFNRPINNMLKITEAEVCREFSKKDPSKAAGPDGLSPKILKLCSSQLAYVFACIFNTSFKTKSVPAIWKKSCIVPVPKKPVINVMNDLRPVALTPEPMKTCERFVLKFLKSLVTDYLDPLQFAYSAGRSCEDAILFVLDKIYSNLENAKNGNSVRIMFFDFSSAFNTIQPHILIDKMLGMNNVPSWLISWIFDYLTQRSQFVRLSEDIKSSIVVSNTGCPQGTVLAPFIFTLFTADIRSLYPSCPLVKFADDTAMLGLIKMDNSNLYEKQIQTFVE